MVDCQRKQLVCLVHLMSSKLKASPADSNSQMLQMYGASEMKTLSHHFFKDDQATELKNQWDDFKFHFLEVRKKWLEFNENIERTELKLQISATDYRVESFQ